MKRRLLIALSATLIASCEKAGQDIRTEIDSEPNAWRVNPNGDLNEFFNCLESAGVTLVSAHRGGPESGLPENAIETMAAVLSTTPALIEIDIATSADGVLYLMHDDTLDRTTTGSGPADQASWDKIRKLKLVDNDGRETPYSVPRFDDVLRWAEGKTLLQLDFKRSTSYEDVADEVKRQNAEDRVILIAYSIAAAAKLHRLMPGAMISLSVNSQSEINRAVASSIPAERIIGFTGTDEPRPRLFSILNGREIEVIFGTLGGRDSIDANIARSGFDEEYAAIAALGVDIIATKRPRASHAALAQAERSPEAGQCGIERTQS